MEENKQEESFIDIREVALKFRSKHEIYVKLTVQWKMYLPEE